MKIRTIFLIVMLMTLVSKIMAQCPQALNYQTIVRDLQGNPAYSNTPVVIRFTIFDSINPGVPLFQEDQTRYTNQFGAFSCYVGEGPTDFIPLSSVNWTAGHKYMEVELDINATGTYKYAGTATLNSVPYALYADHAAKGGYPRHHIGEHYGGGTIFYLTDNGQHGLIADSGDIQTSNDTVLWARVDTTLINAGLSGAGGGFINTERIVVNQGAGNYAANLCANDTTGGYGDWFLPSANELILLYQQQQVIGNLNSSAAYWSSTESANTTASALDFSSGITMDVPKSTPEKVRAIRVF